MMIFGEEAINITKIREEVQHEYESKKALVITTILQLPLVGAIVGATFLPHDADASEIAHSNRRGTISND